MLSRVLRLLREVNGVQLAMQLSQGRLAHAMGSLADDEPELLELELDLVEAEVLALRRELARWDRVAATLSELRYAGDQKKQALWDSLRLQRRQAARVAAAVANEIAACEDEGVRPC